MSRYPRLVLAAVILLGLAGGARAQTFSSVVVFGDSLSDSGNTARLYAPLALSYGFPVPPGTSFTTNPDPVWAEIVARTFGASGTSSLAGGTNYALGGACVNPAGPCEEELGPTQRTGDQIRQHLSGANADPGALYMIWGGANDITAVAENSSHDIRGALDGTLAAAEAYLDQVRILQDAGARHVVVLSLPDIGRTVEARRAGTANPDVPVALSALTRAYNEALDTGMRSLEHGIVPVNTFALMNETIEDPENYGFTDIEGTACAPGSNPLIPDGGAESIVCGPAGSGYLSPPDTDENYFFADGFHPTGAVHAGIGNMVISTLAAPVQVSLGGEGGVEVARAHRDAVFAERIPDTGPGSQVGKWRSYLRGQAGRHRLEALSHLGRTRAETQVLTLGADYRAGDGLYLGAALSLGNHSNGVSGADIDSAAVAGSLHGAFIFDVFYLSGALNAGRSSIDISRSVRLGTALRTEDGSTTSYQYGTDVELGWVLSASEKHGYSLFLGFGWLNQKIDGYRENGSMSTSMNFSDFERGSLIARAGWRFRGNLGLSETVFPYMRVAYEREFDDDAVSVTAGSNTMPGRFTLPGFKPPSQEVNAAAGIALDIGGRTTTFAGYSGRFGSDSRRGHELNFGIQTAF